MKKLSILICTLPERKEKFDSLVKELTRQAVEIYLDGEIEILAEDSGRGVKSVGWKRNLLKKCARGEYIVFFDDDDMPAKNYLKEIIKAIETGADIITFNMDYYVNGKYVRKYIINRFIGEFFTETEYTIDRIFYHLCAVKKELAMKADFPDKNLQEDLEYSNDLKPFLKTEHRINKSLYNYYFDEKLTATRD